MSREKIPFASDNCSPVHPSILKAICEANEGFSPSYGADAWTDEATQLIARELKKQCSVFFVPTGTGSNVLALNICMQRYQSVLCSDMAHIHLQESGALESITGCKILTVPHQSGKVTPSALLKRLKAEKALGKHATFPKVLSITQTTEIGTVYTLEELKSISAFCREENLFLHIDGSRFYNAAALLNVTLSEMVDAANPDVLSLGGTKNGLMGAEALVLLNSSLKEGCDHMQKQTLQLSSKMRYLSAQYIPYFKEGLWKELALSANQKAKQIASVIEAFPEVTLTFPVETNQVFFKVPFAWIPLIQEKVSCYVWNQEIGEIRMIASWNTTDEHVEALKSAFTKISQGCR